MAGLLWALGLGAGCDARTVELSPDGADNIVLTPGTPADTAAAFASAVPGDKPVDPKRLRITYPNDGARIPRNLSPLAVHWKANKDVDRFELRIDTGVAALRVYTTETGYQLTTHDWDRLQTHPPQRLSFELRAIGEKRPGELFEARPVALELAADELPGQLYFWSTQAQGIMRARLDTMVAEKFFPAPDTPTGDAGADCVGCHTLSRDGQRLAMANGNEQLVQLAVRDRSTIASGAEGPAPGYGWGAFDPGASRLLVAHRGRLTLLDADRGTALPAPNLGDMVGATHPDWSPDGRHIALSLLTDKWDDNKAVEGSSIARLPVAIDGSIGPPQVLVQSTGKDDTLCFPAYSPDSRWIAFSRIRGKSKDAKKAELWLVAADGSGEPIALPHLNQRVGAEDDGKDLGNSMPTWAPGVGSDTYWLAFSSSREHGQQPKDDKRDQLWAAAIDARALTAGEDPSAAAFWLPFQQPEDSTHRAFWALAQADSCADALEVCDERDNDCDGTTDEGCCTPEPERCDDGVDNDCDGERDEGCGCALSEVCDNGQDEDCDTRVDEDCVF